MLKIPQPMITTKYNTNTLKNFLRNTYVIADWDEENALIVLNWTYETRYMQETNFKEILLQAADFVEKNKVKYWLANTKDFDYIVEPDIQEWSAGAFNQQLIAAGLEKMAVILPEAYFTQISVQQATDEMAQGQTDAVFQFSYFADVDKAVNWLFI